MRRAFLESGRENLNLYLKCPVPDTDWASGRYKDEIDMEHIFKEHRREDKTKAHK